MSSAALSMRSAYSPMIQTMDALASGSSSDSRLSQSVAMAPSYLSGFHRSSHNSARLALASKTGSQTLLPVRILPEDVFEYDGGLLHHVAHPAAEIPEL